MTYNERAYVAVCKTDIMIRYYMLAHYQYKTKFETLKKIKKRWQLNQKDKNGYTIP